MRVTIMGLGLHGGGLAASLYFARLGAEVTVTDLRDEHTLRSSCMSLREYNVHFQLGGHRKEDFLHADMVIKNPAVPGNSPYLEIARSARVPIETDLSIFLRTVENPIIAVTGSKGKSTTASAVHYCLRRLIPDARLGGNITVSPLSFLPDLPPDVPVVLELSSWQLGDLRSIPVLKPIISVTTVILPDHMDRYTGMAAYINDKKEIYRNQTAAGYAIFNRDDPFQQHFPRETKAQTLLFSAARLPKNVDGAWFNSQRGIARIDGQCSEILQQKILLPGEHNRKNLLSAALALRAFGIDAKHIRPVLSAFPGLAHRLEHICEISGIRFYNDSTSTIPHATVRALESVPPPVFLIAGGTDKQLDFSVLRAAFQIPKKVFLLEGTGTQRMISVLREEAITYSGPYDHLPDAVHAAFSQAFPGVSILFSPGCTSFGMFLNEFDRGNQFKRTVADLHPM